MLKHKCVLSINENVNIMAKVIIEVFYERVMRSEDRIRDNSCSDSSFGGWETLLQDVD